MCFGKQYYRTQVDFLKIYPEELFLVSKVFSHKVEKHHKMKTPYLRVGTYLQSQLGDFTTIDVEIHRVLHAKLELPPLEPLHFITEGIQELSVGATNNPYLGIIFCTIMGGPKNFLPARSFHRCSKK